MPSDKPFFSVIISTYNRRKLIERALNSLFAQSESDWEAIISDDGSNDGTRDFLRELQLTDSRIRYIYHDRVGAGQSKSIGIAKARGRFVTFLDSDDEYEINHLSSRKKILLDKPNLQLLHGGVKVVGNQFVPDAENPGKKIEISKCVIGGTMFIRNELFSILGEFSMKRFGDDKDFFDRVSAAGLKIFETNEQTYIYHRDTEDSVCNKYLDEI